MIQNSDYNSHHPLSLVHIFNGIFVSIVLTLVKQLQEIISDFDYINTK